jgi:hypothetical protein
MQGGRSRAMEHALLRDLLPADVVYFPKPAGAKVTA